MKTKPWPIVALAFLHFIAPIANILFAAHLQQMTAAEYLSTFFEARSYFDLALMLVVPPVAGLAIYMVKRWSYLVFLGIAGLEIYSNVDNWMAYPDSFSFPFLIGAHLINVAIVGYFLVPAVRAPYFNAKLRWWEQKPRFNVNIRGVLQPIDSVAKNSSQCKIIDISEGGAMVKHSRKLNLGDLIKLTFNYYGLSLSLKGKIVHFRKSDGWAYGVQFQELDSDKQNRIALHRLTQAMRLLGIRPMREEISFYQDFRNWLVLRKVMQSKPEEKTLRIVPDPRPSEPTNVIPMRRAS